MGEVGILNVGAGDTKLVFDPKNPAETIRASRIVKDMLRRGYALLVEVDDGAGGKTHTRALDFDAATGEYIIADFDPIVAHEHDAREDSQDEQGAPRSAAASEEGTEAAAPPRPKARRGRPRKAGGEKRVSAAASKVVAVPRTAGG